MKKILDRKRMASGECEDEAGVPLASSESLVEAIKTSRMTQRSWDSEKRLIGPLIHFTQNPGEIEITPLVFDTGPGSLIKIMHQRPNTWTFGMSSYLRDDREIIAEFGKGIQGTIRNMSIGTIDGSRLIREPVDHLYQCEVKVMERLHPLVHKVQISRKELNDQLNSEFNGIVLEVGFYSRTIEGADKHYIGKTKIFFPQPYKNLMLYLDLSKLR